MTRLYKFKEMPKPRPLLDAEDYWQCDNCKRISREQLIQIGHARHACSPDCSKRMAQARIEEWFQ